MTAEYCRLIANRYLASTRHKHGAPSFVHIVIYPVIADAMYRGMYSAVWDGWWTAEAVSILRKDGFLVTQSTDTRSPRRIVISWAFPIKTDPLPTQDVPPAISTPEATVTHLTA